MFQCAILSDLVTSYADNLKEQSLFSSSDDSSEKQAPTTLLWTYYYLAQHYDLLGDTKKALEHIDIALEHTVTLIELFGVKARIYKVSYD